MRNLLLITTIILFSQQLLAQNKIALVIGIGQYPAESGWSEINGDKDIDIICSFLYENGFEKENIITLENEQATKNNIIKHFEIIKNLSKSDDFVYIHFSGHGQRITDLDGDEDSGLDEAWIPFDAKKDYNADLYTGENHLIDDEINILLTNIRSKIGENGQILVVADACHSGDSTRGEDDEHDNVIIRGVLDNFIIPNVPKQNKTKESIPIQWTLISACKPYQNNHECVVDGKNYGSLSYSLYSQRFNLANVSLNLIDDMLEKKMKELIPNYYERIQTIQIETFDYSSEQILFKK